MDEQDSSPLSKGAKPDRVKLYAVTPLRGESGSTVRTLVLLVMFPGRGYKGSVLTIKISSPIQSSSTSLLVCRHLLTMPRAIWTKILSDIAIKRSSQTLAILASNAYIYGGELRPREPVDSAVYRLSLDACKSP